MKSLIVAASAALALMACSQKSYPTSDPYPQSKYPDQNPYPADSRSYPQQGQRDGVVTVIRIDNSNNNYEHLPPGQAKKRYGGRSARVYAPGQQRKNGYGYGIATVIAVPDRYASRSNSGQFYYNYRGNSYWKQNDGYYYIDNNYRR